MLSVGNKNPGYQNQNESNLPNLTDEEYELFRDLIYKKCAIVMKESKKSLLANRLGRRLRLFNLTNYKDYYKYLLTTEGYRKEFTNMVDCVTTNKTDFFRNQKHFQILTNLVLPELIANKEANNRRTLRIWSAGCSSGEEPYSLAIVLHMLLGAEISNWDVRILATDISTRMLEKAKSGIYRLEDVEQLPQNIKKSYFLKGAGRAKVKDHLKKIIRFDYLNFIEPFNSIKEKFDIVFCRNVIIYFDRETQIKLIGKFHNILLPQGYIFLGHSESMHSISDRFTFVSPSVYHK